MRQRGAGGLNVVLRILLLGVLLVVPPALLAEEDTSRYVEMKPTFVVNYGFVDGGRMKFIRADVQLRAQDRLTARLVRHHLPLLRDAMLQLLSRQEESAVMTSQGREVVRSMALTEMRELMMQEEGEPCIDDVIFSNFLVQR